MEYINYIKAKAHLATASKSEKPVLSEEDESFLNRITSDDNPRPFTPISDRFNHGGDAQVALMDGAQNIALPEDDDGDAGYKDHLAPSGQPFLTPDSPTEGRTTAEAKKVTDNKGRTTWSWLRRDSRDRKSKHEAQTLTADSLHDLAQGLKSPDAKPNDDHTVSDAEAKQEEEDMTIVLERLNLAAVNNRVFSISDETQELLQQFNQIFKDLIRGVPTAYDDLESLLTNGDRQLQKTYNSLPPFLQKLIEKLPEAMTKGLAPEMMAVAAERAGKAGYNMEHAGKAAAFASKIAKIPSLKELVAKPSAIATMLRSIINFLRARFPAFMGMNVLWSLAMFVLLFVFWYCYKRGKEVRLEKERELTEQEMSRLDAQWMTKHPGARFTTAPPGASIDEVKAGIKEMEMETASRAEAAAASPTTSPILPNVVSSRDPNQAGLPTPDRGTTSSGPMG